MIIKYFKFKYRNKYLCTGNFLAGSLNNKNFKKIFETLDYICVNHYGGYPFENCEKSQYTPEKMVEHVTHPQSIFDKK